MPIDYVDHEHRMHDAYQDMVGDEPKRVVIANPAAELPTPKPGR